MKHEPDLLPRRRFAGPLVLDLLLRDALIGENRLHLHPREFELLWRLSETPGVPVSRGDLLREVWGLNYMPSTNTLEVHVCRLRAKLAPVGVAWVVATAPDGGYFVDVSADTQTGNGGAGTPRALDSHVRIGDEGDARQKMDVPNAIPPQ